MDAGPELVSEILDADLSPLGYVVIDSTVNGLCCGGIRMGPEVSLSEMTDLAKAMTLKFGLTRSAMGGAKVGVIGDPEGDPDERHRRLRAFGQALEPILRGHRWIPGLDMGTTQEDLMVILGAMRKKARGVTSFSMSAFYTGLTVVAAARAAARHTGTDLAGSTLAIDGFGKVGSSAARLFSESGVNVVAISTARGAIYNGKGLDVDRLVELYHRVGSRVVEVYDGADQVERHELLELPVDVLSPCSGRHVINGENAGRVAARIICPGANVPVAPEAEQVLLRRGMVSVPDFIASCGGVLADTMNVAGPGLARNLIEGGISGSVARILREAEKAGVSPREIAEPLARERFQTMRSAAESRMGGVAMKLARSAFQRYKGLGLPDLPIRPLCAWYARRRMDQL